MNKFALRGIVLMIIGSLVTWYSLDLMESGDRIYKALMSIGVLLFGIGVVTFIYAVFRKIDRQTLKSLRKNQQNTTK